VNNNDYDDLLETAHELFKEGKFDQAETILNQLILKNQKKPIVFHLLGTIYYDRGKFNKAIRAFRRALEIDPSFTDASVGLSIILNDLGKYDEGKKVFQEAQAMLGTKDQEQDSYINEKIAIKHDELGELYANYKRYKEAMEQYLKALLLSKRKPELNLKVVNCLRRLGEKDKAIFRLKDLLKKYPDFISARVLLGEILFENKQNPEATHELERVLKIEPNNQIAKNLLNELRNHNLIHTNK